MQTSAVALVPGKKSATKSLSAQENPSRKPASPPSPDRIMQLAWAYAPPLILQAALGFKLFDLLEDSPKSAPELARRAEASERGITSILNALVGLEFLSKEGDRYSLTPESATYLVSTSPAYRGAFFHHTVHQLIPRWMQLKSAVRTGRPVYAVNEEESGSSFFAEFVESLFPLSAPAAQALARHLGLRNTHHPVSVLDLGAGAGVWGITLAQESPYVRIHAVDWPRVLEVTRKVAEQHGVNDRLTTAAGDLLEADFGSGHQVATIGHILHSEGPQRSRKLLRRTFDSLAPGGTVAIAEWIPNDQRTGPPGPLLFGVNMLVHTEAGDTFTFAEMSDWLLRAGFKNPRLLEVPGPCPLVLATK